MVGRILGLGLLHEQRIPVHFATPLIKQILGIELCMDDLEQLDPDVYKHIISLRDLDTDELAQLNLDFTVDECNFGKRRKVTLMLGGDDVSVTKGNLEVFLRLYAEYYLNRSATMLSSLKTGLHQFCPKVLLMAAGKCFTPEDFDAFLSGTEDIDVDDLQAQRI